jgi:putative sterol carrier protein
MAQRLNDSLARAYARTSPRVRALALRRPHGRLVMRGIFRTMERSFDREKGREVTAVMHWEIAGSKGRTERWQVAIADGRCRAGRELDREPTMTLKLDGRAFLDLVSGAVPGPALFMSGRIKIDGDPMRAAQMTSLFRVPKPAPR